MNIARNITSVLTACLLLLGGHVAYADIAGQAQFVNGSVQIIPANGHARALAKGEVIHENDTILTGRDSFAQVRMMDGGLIAIRPDSQLKFDSFAFNGEQDGSEHSFFSLLKGGVRAITGLVGRVNKPNYRITTPTATIGIRGTDHETYVVVPGSELAATIPPGTYNKVNTGGTVVTNAAGFVNVQPNQMGYAGAPDQPPQLLPVNLRLFTAALPSASQPSAGLAEVRASVVVDNGVQGLGALPATLAVMSGGPNVRVPIVGQYQVTTGGLTAAPQTQTYTIVF